MSAAQSPLGINYEEEINVLELLYNGFCVIMVLQGLKNPSFMACAS
jgi:hypothetical protein